MKALAPVLILGTLLAVLVFTARCTQRAMHRHETAAGDVDQPNSAPSGLAEQERMLQRFPDSLLSPNGIRHQVLLPGTGPKPIPGNRVKVHYTGSLLDGTVFDTSARRGEPYAFTVMKSEVIRGWDLTLPEMRLGERRRVIIPSELAYGARGAPPTIPPRAPLVFEIELVAIE